MENKLTLEDSVSQIFEDILGLLGLEGSFEVTEGVDEVMVTIEANDPGRLIGFKGETLDALQLISNLIVSQKLAKVDPEAKYKRVVVDVSNWRKNKEADLERMARNWATEVLENKEPVELDPMPSWQRRIIHMVIQEMEGVESESIGEGRDRHLVIRPIAQKKAKKSKKEEVSPEEANL